MKYQERIGECAVSLAMSGLQRISAGIKALKSRVRYGDRFRPEDVASPDGMRARAWRQVPIGGGENL